MTSARWQIAEPFDPSQTNFSADTPTLIAQLLWNRGIRDADEAEQFLRPHYERDVHDPFLFRHMERAVVRLARAIAEHEKIFVHGDYDADGICAAAILTSTLRMLGADVEGFIPHRELDGYGLRHETVDALAARGARIIITCDCGISNAPEIAHANGKNITVIVTDHHTIPAELPKAYALLHPKIADETYPDKGLSGGGVAFKLMQGLLQHDATKKFLPTHAQPDAFQKWQLDLVAIASVADMVPLIGETRTLVHYGCLVLGKTRRPGLRALITRDGVVPRITPQTIGFKISPRLNAAGRMDHGKTAFDLLLTDNAAEADRLADELNTHNANRQKLVDTIVRDARARIARDELHTRGVLVVAGEQWPAGVLGLVASRLKEEFYKPTFVIGINARENDTSPRVVGSGRSIEEWNMIAAMQTRGDLFVKFGGHPQACGFTLADAAAIEPFATAMSACAIHDVAALQKLIPTLAIDARVRLHELDWTLVEQLEHFAPFGIGNPEPKFLSEQLRVVRATPLGREQKHVRVMVQNGTPTIKKMVGFGMGRHATQFAPGATFDGVYEFGVNEWNGSRELQYKLHDVKFSNL